MFSLFECFLLWCLVHINAQATFTVINVTIWALLNPTWWWWIYNLLEKFIVRFLTFLLVFLLTWTFGYGVLLYCTKFVICTFKLIYCCSSFLGILSMRTPRILLLPHILLFLSFLDDDEYTIDSISPSYNSWSIASGIDWEDYENRGSIGELLEPFPVEDDYTIWIRNVTMDFWNQLYIHHQEERVKIVRFVAIKVAWAFAWKRYPESQKQQYICLSVQITHFIQHESIP